MVRDNIGSIYLAMLMRTQQFQKGVSARQSAKYHVNNEEVYVAHADAEQN